jgi:hypothetical protein
MLARVTDTTLQIFGGMGLMDDFPIERFWRDARVERIWDGTSEIQRHIISRDLFARWGLTAVQPLSRLLRPRSIAVIGGGTWCANVIEECRKIGFPGPVWPVHPTRDGWRAASVSVGRGSARGARRGLHRCEPNCHVEAVRILAERGAGGAVCFASGFRESVKETGDGDVLEAALVDGGRARCAFWGRTATGFSTSSTVRRSGPTSTARVRTTVAWR